MWGGGGGVGGGRGGGVEREPRGAKCKVQRHYMLTRSIRLGTGGKMSLVHLTI